jgi:hypothetical protein
MHAIVPHQIIYQSVIIINIMLSFCWTGYLLREIRKASIAVPEEEASPAAPPPKAVLEIMVGYSERPLDQGSLH